MKRHTFALLCLLLSVSVAGTVTTKQPAVLRQSSDNVRTSSAPVVSNVSASQRMDGSKIIDITYNLADPNDDICTVSLKVSGNNGLSFNIFPLMPNLSGDIGAGIIPGAGKHIVWNAGAENYELNGSYQYYIQADDLNSIEMNWEYKLVNGGTFNNGTTNVTVGSLYMLWTEVTQSQFFAVMGYNPAHWAISPSTPVHSVNWFEAIEYCNRRSISEGLMPCYSYGTYGQNPDNWPAGWDGLAVNRSNVHWNWNAVGYRLPTEMEWEFSARGGNLTHGYTYSGSNDIYAVAAIAPFATLPVTVGLKAPNELGIYDMSGNVAEWCWDIFGEYRPEAQSNPTGAASGGYQVTRGGAWDTAGLCPVNMRDYRSPLSISDSYGFRVCLSTTETAQSVPAPVFYPLPGTYYNPLEVSIRTASLDAVIRWTDNGSNPDEGNGNVYSSPLTLTSGMALKAVACTGNNGNSTISTVLYTLVAASPVFSLPAGAYGDLFSVELSSITTDAVIYYTTDGSTPSQQSGTLYSAPVPVASDLTLKAVAISPLLGSSPVSSVAYTLKTATPGYAMPSGVYTNAVTVTLSCPTVNSAIYYTLDGSTPSAMNGSLYTAPFALRYTTTVKAIAVRTGFADSDVNNAGYTVVFPLNEDFMLVQGGVFNNGTSDVTLNSFYLDKLELTQSAFQAVMGFNPSYYGGNPNFPVEFTSWYQAVEYCNRRSIAENLLPCYSYASYGTNPNNWPVGWNTGDNNHLNISCDFGATGYRLPTEMEWMYAARGGNQSQGYIYCGGNNVNEVAWCATNSGTATHNTGSLNANELGLFDMGGNVWEWCWDIFAGSYPAGSQVNPTGPASGSYRLMRGASAFSPADQCNPVFRNTIWTTFQDRSLGFRICRSVPLMDAEVTAPVFDTPPDEYFQSVQIALSCSTAGAMIRYTTDGSVPSPSNGTLYLNPFTITTSAIVKAVAFFIGHSSSLVTVRSFVIYTGMPPSFIPVQSGTFNNGTSEVAVSNFFIDPVELTQSHYKAVMGDSLVWTVGVGPYYPAHSLSWFNAIEYCNRRSIMEGLTPCYSYLALGTNPDDWPAGWDTENSNHLSTSCNWTADGYRLPTDMEWMHAARGGIQSHNYTYSGGNDLYALATFINNWGWYNNFPQTVASMTPNELGIYDMSGNLFEWCWDIYAASPDTTRVNPTGPVTGTSRLMRGGSFVHDSNICTVAFRNENAPTYNYNCAGFRVCRIVTTAYPQTLAAPIVYPNGGSYDSNIYAELYCQTPGAFIRYTLDGNTPSENYGTLYTEEPILISGICILKAMAYLLGYNTSAVMEIPFTIVPPAIGSMLYDSLANLAVSPYEVTQGEYQAVMGTNPASGSGVGDNYPVYNVSWQNAVEYCNRRSIAEGKSPVYSYSTYGTDPNNWPAGWNTGFSNSVRSFDVQMNQSVNGYRLPTESEWLYLASGGDSTLSNVFSGSNTVNYVAWYSGNSGITSHTVGTKNSNELRLYDMSGNLWEWCWDYTNTYSPGSPPRLLYSKRAVRGGSWADAASNCTVSSRAIFAPYTLSAIGFRVIRTENGAD